MNLKLKRLVRTASSEQYALFDLDQLDHQQQPMTIGKLDMHYTGEGVYGTILFWDDALRELNRVRRENLIQALLEEIAQPMGVPNEFVVEFFAPSLDEYHVFHNLDRDAPNADDELDETALAESEHSALDDDESAYASPEPTPAGVRGSAHTESEYDLTNAPI